MRLLLSDGLMVVTEQYGSEVDHNNSEDVLTRYLFSLILNIPVVVLHCYYYFVPF